MLRFLKSGLNKTKSLYNRWANAILQGTHHHFCCAMPTRISWLSHNMLKLFYRGITVSPEQTTIIQQIEPGAILVYANKFQSRFEYLFYYTRYKKLKLPIPQIGLGYKIRIWQPASRVFRGIFSTLDHLLRHHRFADPFRSDYIHDALTGGQCGFLSLVAQKGFYRRFVRSEPDPLEYLVEMQQRIDRPIYIVPHLMFFDRTPPARS